MLYTSLGAAEIQGGKVLLASVMVWHPLDRRAKEAALWCLSQSPDAVAGDSRLCDRLMSPLQAQQYVLGRQSLTAACASPCQLLRHMLLVPNAPRHW